jgi:putative membrane protein
MAYLQGLSAFATYFGMGFGFVLLYVVLYLHLTPHRELALIRAGNLAASVALAGALLGFALPLAGALRAAVSALDLALWAGIALLAQGVAYLLVRVLLPRFPDRIAQGELSAAVLSATAHISVGLVNAAAMSY